MKLKREHKFLGKVELTDSEGEGMVFYAFHIEGMNVGVARSMRLGYWYDAFGPAPSDSQWDLQNHAVALAEWVARQN